MTEGETNSTTDKTKQDKPNETVVKGNRRGRSGDEHDRLKSEANAEKPRRLTSKGNAKDRQKSVDKHGNLSCVTS